MSVTSTPAALPDPQTAFNTIAQNVRHRVFFAKCAAAGLEPQTVEHAQLMLEMAGQLRAVDDSPAVKAAAAREDPIHRMHAALNATLAEAGFRRPAGDEAIKAAAHDFAQDPAIYNAVLSLRADEAAQYATPAAA